MAVVFQDIQLSWNGAEYTVTPTFKLIQRIEQRYSITATAQRMTEGDTPLSHVAGIVGELLRSAGADVSDEEVFAEMFAGDQEAVQAMAIALIQAACPIQPATKPAKAKPKKAAPAKKAGAK